MAALRLQKGKEMTLMKNPVTCPTCKRESKHFIVLMGEERQPRAGDISVCADCGELRRYDSPTSFHRMGFEEEMEIAEQRPGVWALMIGQRLAVLRSLE